MISIDRGRGFATIVVEGRATLATLSKLADELMAHPDYTKGMNTLWDGRNADLSEFGQAVVLQLMEEITRKLFDPNRAVAFCVSNDLNFGMMRMLGTYAELSFPQRYRVFKDIDQAVDWLTLDRRRRT